MSTDRTPTKRMWRKRLAALALAGLVVIGATGAARSVTTTRAAFTDTATASAAVSAGSLAKVTTMTCKNGTQSGKPSALVTWPAVPGASGYIVHFKSSSVFVQPGDDFYPTNQANVGIDRWAYSLYETKATLTVRAWFGPSQSKIVWEGVDSTVSIQVRGMDNNLLSRYVYCDPESA